MEPLLSDKATFLAASSGIMLLIMLWTIPWKGWALWRAAQLNDRWWFIILLLAQTAGILEIIYLFFIRPENKNNKV